MKGPNSRAVLPVITAVVGVLWIFVGLTYHGWWVDEKPGSGFFPTIVGALLLLVSILALIAELKAEPPMFMRAHMHPLLAAVSVVALALLIGFFPALTLYVFGWTKWYEKYSWKFASLVTVITIAGMYGVFAMWLRVPYPQGVILDMVMN